MRYRIKESRHDDGVQRFYPQRKGWFFWHCYYEERLPDDISNDGLIIFSIPPDPIAFNTLMEAKGFLDLEIKPKHVTVYHEM